MTDRNTPRETPKVNSGAPNSDRTFSDQPSADQPSADQPSADQPSADQPVRGEVVSRSSEPRFPAMTFDRLLQPIRLAGNSGFILDSGQSPFRADGNRLVFSSAFRRLQGKMQVHAPSSSDTVRNRLTHSLETSRVGRALAHMATESLLQVGVYPQSLPANALGEVVEAGCLAHDIGSLPFGHAGEAIVQDWFRTSEIGTALIDLLPSPAQRLDFLRYEGNAQGFRMITRGTNGSFKTGLNLTLATIASMVKYPCGSTSAEGSNSPCASRRKFNAFDDDMETLTGIADMLGMTRIAGDPHTAPRFLRHPAAFLVEAADDITYRMVDIEDAFRLDFLDYGLVKDLYREILAASEHMMDDAWRQECATAMQARARTPEQRNDTISTLRSACIAALTAQAARVFCARISEILDGSYDREILDDVPASEALEHVKGISVDRVFRAPRRVESLIQATDSLAGILNSFGLALLEHHTANGDGSRLSVRTRQILQRHPDILGAPAAGGGTPQSAGQDVCAPASSSLYHRLLAMVGYIAGMTDTYAIERGSALGGGPQLLPSRTPSAGAWNIGYLS